LRQSINRSPADISNRSIRYLDCSLVDCWPPWHRLNDRFFFRFWPVEKKHVERINFILLDNLPQSKSVVFNSQPSFKKTLESYLTTSANGFKLVGVGEHGSRISRLDCLRKLSTILSKLGCENATFTFDSVGLHNKSFVQSVDKIWVDMMGILLESGDRSAFNLTSSDFWELYSLLGMVPNNDRCCIMLIVLKLQVEPSARSQRIWIKHGDSIRYTRWI
jgi:hypothetical protein